MCVYQACSLLVGYAVQLEFFLNTNFLINFCKWQRKRPSQKLVHNEIYMYKIVAWETGILKILMCVLVLLFCIQKLCSISPLRCEEKVILYFLFACFSSFLLHIQFQYDPVSFLCQRLHQHHSTGRQLRHAGVHYWSHICQYSR